MYVCMMYVERSSVFVAKNLHPSYQSQIYKPLMSAGLIFKSLQLCNVCSIQWYTVDIISLGSCSTHLEFQD